MSENKYIPTNDSDFKEKLYNNIKAYYMNIKNEYIDENELEEIINQIMALGKGPVNRCIECGIDLGECNPRQLCGKGYCYFE